MALIGQLVRAALRGLTLAALFAGGSLSVAQEFQMAADLRPVIAMAAECSDGNEKVLKAFTNGIPAQQYRSEQVQNFCVSEKLAAPYFAHLSSGEDIGQDGVNHAALVFFDVAHGELSSFHGKDDGDLVAIDAMRLGAGNSPLRYFLQCSCNTFAHGPSTDGVNFARPGDYQRGLRDSEISGSSGITILANVFERWRYAVLGMNLRMACGGSTQVDCSPERMRFFWQLKTDAGLNVASAYILALAGGRHVPLCLALSKEPADAALFDGEFESGANPAASAGIDVYYNIEYPISESLSANPQPTEIPYRLDLIEESTWSGYSDDRPRFVAGDSPGFDASLFRDSEIREKRFIGLEPEPRPGGMAVTDLGREAQEKAAAGFLRNTPGWWEDDMDSIPSYRLDLWVDSMRNGQAKRHFHRSAVFFFTRSGLTAVDRAMLRIEDEKAFAVVEVSPEGKVLHAYKYWRAAAPGPTVPIDVAQEIARVLKSMDQEHPGAGYFPADVRIHYSLALGERTREIPKLVIDFNAGVPGFDPLRKELLLPVPR